jgi:hypothetical protein
MRLTYEAESFVVRLITVADDFGRFEAEADILHGLCYPLVSSAPPHRRATVDDVERWREELRAVDMIRLYDVDGKTFGFFVNWEKHQRVRGKTSKWPAPPNGGAAAATSPPAPPPPAPSTKKRITFDAAAGKVVGVETADVERWRELYPNVDITAHLGAATDWLWRNRHLERVQKMRDIPKYLSGWFAREQKKAPQSQNGASRPPLSSRPAEGDWAGKTPRTVEL